jgi:hypothetical protein
MRVARYDAIPNFDTGNGAACTAHYAQIAITDPAGIIRCVGDTFCTFVIAPVCADLECADKGLNPDFVRQEMIGIQWTLFDLQVARPVQHSNFHHSNP